LNEAVSLGKTNLNSLEVQKEYGFPFPELKCYTRYGERKFDKTPQFDFKNATGEYFTEYSQSERPFIQDIIGQGLVNKYIGEGFKKVVKVDYGTNKKWF